MRHGSEHGRTTQAGRMGFTLVELLVVISIIALLASLILPSLGSAKEAAQRVACGSNLHQLALGHKNYETAYSGIHCRARDYLTTEAPAQSSVQGIPGWPNISTIPEQSILILGRYISGGRELFRCPSDNMERKDCTSDIRYIRPPTFSFTRNGEVQGVGPGGYLSSRKIRRPSDTMMLFEEWEYAPFNDAYVIANSWDLISQRHNGRGQMAFYDGSAGSIDAQTFNQQTPLWRQEVYLDP